MASFLVRVELNGGKPEDYEVLHEAMEEKGFEKTVELSKGGEKKLPTGLYVGYGKNTTKQVTSYASEAAAKTGRKYQVVVAEYVGSLMTKGLEDAEE